MKYSSQRIFKNTLILYARQMLILLVNLYLVRVLLSELGVEGYGIYSAVAGVVLLLSFLSGAMASATQRYFSFALAGNNQAELNKVFSVNIVIYGSIALIAFVFLETAGLWFIGEHLRVPVERLGSSMLLYQFSIFAFIATVFSAPFMSIIIAHEDMHVYAYVSILDALLKLGSAFLLALLSYDKLEMYGILFFAAAAIITIVYVGVCLRRYPECQFRYFYWDSALFKDIGCFTGWTFLGQFTTVVRTHAITILLNQSFSPVVVAARAIAINVASQTIIFANNFNTSLYPPIVKTYAEGSKPEMFSLIFNGSKITFFLMWVVALPMFLSMDYILHAWLINPPSEALFFTRLALVDVLISAIALPVATAARASGRVKMYELTLGSMQLAVFIVAWLVLKAGGAAYTVFIVAILANILIFFIRLLIVKMLVDLSLVLYFRKVFFPVLWVVLLSAPPSLVVHILLPEGIMFMFISVLTSVLLSSVAMYNICLDKKWKKKVFGFVFDRFQCASC